MDRHAMGFVKMPLVVEHWSAGVGISKVASGHFGGHTSLAAQSNCILQLLGCLLHTISNPASAALLLVIDAHSSSDVGAACRKIWQIPSSIVRQSPYEFLKRQCLQNHLCYGISVVAAFTCKPRAAKMPSVTPCHPVSRRSVLFKSLTGKTQAMRYGQELHTYRPRDSHRHDHVQPGEIIKGLEQMLQNLRRSAHQVNAVDICAMLHQELNCLKMPIVCTTYERSLKHLQGKDFYNVEDLLLVPCLPMQRFCGAVWPSFQCQQVAS